jgi:hypothetical protein
LEYIIKWKKESYNQIYYSDLEIPANAKLMPLYFNKNLSVDKLGQINKLNLLYLDTNRNSEGHYFRIYANPELFDTLAYYNAVQLDGEEVLIARMSKSLIDKKVDLKSLIRTMIATGMIGTYHHLSADMVEIKEMDTDEVYELKFSVVWHICTSKCSHPKYKFNVRVDKENWEISVFK